MPNKQIAVGARTKVLMDVETSSAWLRLRRGVSSSPSTRFP